MVTIIITAYNVAKTLAKAIQSCIDQTYKDLEILVINDCSTDNTLEVAQSFADDRIRILTNEINQGAGMSRRRGTKEAKGDYTIFLDGDDYIDKDYVETLYNLAKEHNADIVSSGLRTIDGDVAEELQYEGVSVVKGPRFLEEDSESKHLINVYLNTKLVARKLWDKVEYSGRRFVEDTQTCFFLTFFSDNIVRSPYVGYNYVQNPNSLCHQSSRIKHNIYKALCAKDVCEFIKENKREDFKLTLDAFLVRLREVGSMELPDTIRDEYKEELAELFTFFLQNIQF